MKNPDLILFSDIHARETLPECRVDDFDKAFWNKMKFVKELQKEHDCPILCGGDLFHHWKPSPNLLRMCIAHFPKEIYTIYGQHDLPQHNWENRSKSGIAVLEAAGILSVLPNCHWGQDPGLEEYSSFEIGERQILVWHKMVWQGKRPWPGCTDPSATALLKKYPEYDLILTGDNHKTFVETCDERLLVNPGSFSRQTADQIDHRPCVFLYSSDENTVEKVHLPIDRSAVSRVHLERSERRDERIGAFIEKIGGEWQASMSFEDNLEIFFKTNTILASVKNIVYKAIERKV